MAIKIPFVADVAGFLRGTDDVVGALEDIQGSLDDLGRSRGAESAEEDLEGIGKAADASAEKLETSFSAAFDKLKAEGRTATRSVRDDVDRVGDGAFSDFRDEAKQNLAESVSSFQGDAESAVDAVQSTFGGLATALGPAGVVGSVIVAAGIGVLRGMAQKAQEAAEQVAENAVEMAKSLRDGIPPAEQLNAALEKLAETSTTTGRWFWTEASTGLRDLVRQAEEAEVGVGEFLSAAAGTDAKATQEQLDGITARIKAINDEIKRGDPQLQSRMLSEYSEELGHLGAAADTLTTQLETQKAAAAAYNAELQYGPMRAEELSGSTAGLADAMADAAESTSDANDALAENARLTGTAKASVWDMKDAFEGVAAAAKENGKSLSDNTRKGRENQRAIKDAVDAINDYGAAQIEAGASTTDTNKKLKAQENVLVKDVMKAFGLTEKQARSYIETLGGIPPKKTTAVNVDDKGTAAATTRKVNDIPTSKTVKVSVDARGVQEEIQRVVGGKVYRFDVAPRPGKAVGL